MVSIMIMVSGILFGIVPVFAMMSNGLLLGVVVRHESELSGYGKVGPKVLPHGIIEIPALPLLLAASYGLWLGVTLVRRIRGRESMPIRFHIEHAFRSNTVGNPAPLYSGFWRDYPRISPI
jgi:stage II sporulation protein M